MAYENALWWRSNSGIVTQQCIRKGPRVSTTSWGPWQQADWLAGRLTRIPFPCGVPQNLLLWVSLRCSSSSSRLSIGLALLSWPSCCALTTDFLVSIISTQNGSTLLEHHWPAIDHNTTSAHGNVHAVLLLSRRYKPIQCHGLGWEQ